MGGEAGQYTASSDAFETAWVLPHVSAAPPGLCGDCTLLEVHAFAFSGLGQARVGSCPSPPIPLEHGLYIYDRGCHQQPPISPGVVNAAPKGLEPHIAHHCAN